MSKKFQGKIAVITGGSTGLGLAAAKELASQGAHVFITGRRKKELDAAVKDIGKNATAVVSDVTNPVDLDQLYKTVSKKGKIDILFANAGFYQIAPLSDATEEHIDQLLNTNIKGVILTVQKALPYLKDGASVILNASALDCKGLEGFSVYNATKAAVRSLARTWANELKARKIRVNTLSPGLVPTEGYHTGLGMNNDQIGQWVSQFTPNVPLGRSGKPEEIAKAFAFLASDDASYMTGSEVTVDGGYAQV